MAQTSPYSDLQQRPTPVADAMELGERAWERAATAGETVSQTARQHPIATVALIAGLAFAVGALWKTGRSRQPSRVDSVLARLASLQNELPSRWQV